MYMCSRLCHTSPLSRRIAPSSSVALALSPRPAFATRRLCRVLSPFATRRMKLPLHTSPRPVASPSSRNAAATWCVFSSFSFTFADVPFCHVHVLAPFNTRRPCHVALPPFHVSPSPCVTLVVLPCPCCVILHHATPFLHGMSPLPRLVPLGLSFF